jgi:ADP-ribosylglycohydrolase
MLLGLVLGDAIYSTQTTLSQQSLESFTDDEVPLPGEIGPHSKLAFAEAEAVFERRGFDAETVGIALAEALEEGSAPPTLDPRSINTLETLSVENAGGELRNCGPVTEPPGFDPLVRNCILAPAYLSFPDELLYVTRCASQITHSEKDIATASVWVTAVLAELLAEDKSDPVEVLKGVRTGHALDRRHPIPANYEGIARSVSKFRERSTPLKDYKAFQREGSAPELFLRSLAIAGFGTDDIKEAFAVAVRSAWAPDVLTPLIGAIMGARFGADLFPDEWQENLHEQTRVQRLASQLVALDEERSSSPQFVNRDETPIVHGRRITGPTYLLTKNRYNKADMLRPEPAPHTYPGVLWRELTPSQAVFYDWEHRAHRGLTDRLCSFARRRYNW